jgi:16S rRNA (uracil1498-N3)-methyltransferase
MRRFYVQPEFIKGNKIIITQGQLRHLKDVLRLKKGAPVAVFDGKGNEYHGLITMIKPTETIVDVISKKFTLVKEVPYKVTLAQAVSKNIKMDLVVQKSTELGVDSIIPLNAERSTVKLDQQAALTRKKRWQRIAQEASRQCARSVVPVITDCLNIKEAVDILKASDLKLFFCIDKEATVLRLILDKCGKSTVKDIAIFIGPEGDFSPREIVLAKENGWHLASLGERVLRTETAGLYVLSILDYILGEQIR